jgi:hypothetical protein
MSVFSGGDAVPSVPIFRLPQGYQKLWLVDASLGNCSLGSRIILTSGMVVGLGGGYYGQQRTNYDYCAAVSPTGPVGGFTIRWSLGQFPPYSPPTPLFKISISPAAITLPAGQNGSSTVFVMSLGKFNGTVSFSGGFDSRFPDPMGYPELFFQPANVLVKAGGSNSTTVTVVTFSNTQLGLHVIAIDGQGVGWTDTKDINVTVI